MIIIDHTKIPGLHLEAPTFNEMCLAIQEMVPELMGNLNLPSDVDEIVVKVFMELGKSQKPRPTLQQGLRTRVLVEQPLEGAAFSAA